MRPNTAIKGDPAQVLGRIEVDRDRAARRPMVLGLKKLCQEEDLSRLLVRETPVLRPHSEETSRQPHALEVELSLRPTVRSALAHQNGNARPILAPTCAARSSAVSKSTKCRVDADAHPCHEPDQDLKPADICRRSNHP
jgi:hypothetical protein